MLRKNTFSAGAGLLLTVLLSMPVTSSAEDGTSKAAEPNTLRFESAYRKVLAYYPCLQSQEAKIEEAVASKFEAYAALLPKVQGVSSVTYGDDPVYVFGSLLRQKKFSSQNFELPELNHPDARTNFNFAFRGEVPLFNAFQTISRIRSSRYLEKSEREKKQFMEMEAFLLGMEGYLHGLLTGENLKWTRQVLEAGLDDLKQADELKSKGMVLGADFYAAKVILAGIKQTDYQTSADERVSRILLNILMGEPAEADYALSGKIPEKPWQIKSLREWLEDAYRSRPDLTAFEDKVNAQRVETSREQLSALPKIVGFGDVTEDTHDFRTGGANFLMGFRGSIDILDAGYWARRKKAKAAYDAIRQDYQTLKDRVATEVSQAVNGLEAILSNLPIAEEAFNDSLEAAKQTEILYREGRKSIADLLEIRRAFLYAAFKRNELLFQAEMAYANLLFLSGKLNETAMEEIAKRIDGAA